MVRQIEKEQSLIISMVTLQELFASLLIFSMMYLQNPVRVITFHNFVFIYNFALLDFICGFVQECVKNKQKINKTNYMQININD